MPVQSDQGLCYLPHSVYMSCVMRKPDFCIFENKDADQLCCDRAAGQSLFFAN